jgi:hypothetical protein
LPDGRHFLYLLQNSSPGQTGIYVGSLDAKIKKLLLTVNFSAVSHQLSTSRKDTCSSLTATSLWRKPSTQRD